jgi:hypothetical protein
MSNNNNFSIDSLLQQAPSKRPIYETPEDIIRESSIQEEFIEAVYGDNELVKAVKLPKFYAIDYALTKYNGKIIGWLEIKSRTIPSDKYSSYILSYKKWREGISISQESNLPYYLAVKWTDKLGVITFPNCIQTNLVIGGRFDRSDPDDTEPMVEIPITPLAFKFY